MIVYEAGEYCEIDSIVYEVLESGWNPEKSGTWTMVLRPCDGRVHQVQVHDTEPVMRFGGELSPPPPPAALVEKKSGRRPKAERS
ncbi:MAG: hypothetical protein ACRYGL_12465 [Janthinobacterium lividum]